MNGPGPLKAILIAGGARAVNILLLIVRAKIIAQLLGPEGIGLMGLLASIQEAGAQTADGGLSHSSVRQIARTRKAKSRIARLRRALALAVICLGLMTAATIWIFRSDLSLLMTGSTAHDLTFGLLGIGIALMMIYRWQLALLNGYQRIWDLAKVTTLAAGNLGAVRNRFGLVLGHGWDHLGRPSGTVGRGAFGTDIRAPT